jgi:hypothetical protein
MKNLFFIFLLFLGFNVNAQWFKPNESYGTVYNGGAFQKVLLMPSRCGAPSGSVQMPIYGAQAAICYDTCNSKLYIYNPHSTGWAEFTGGGGETKNEPLLSYILDLRKSYKTAMLSNIAGSSLDRRFPNNELAQYFDVVAASADIGYAKPDREAYLHVADALGVRPEECLFTDDKEGFCTAATSVGMHSIVYTDFIQFKTALGKILAT